MLETETEVEAQGTILLDRLSFLAYVPFNLNVDKVCRTFIVCNQLWLVGGHFYMAIRLTLPWVLVKLPTKRTITFM